MRTELDSPLGKPAPYTEQYTPELLFSIPRAEKRREIGLTEPLPFVGEDVWNAYELSWLDAKAKPAVAVGRFRVPATTPNLIESKSLKLYLNSLNQTSFPDADAVAATLEKDLSAASGGKVGVEVFLPEAAPQRFVSFSGCDCLDALDLACDICASYAPEPDFLRVNEGAVVEKTLYSRLLKSNCPVTGQPDWATISVRYRGRPIDAAGLLRYIVSFRRHSEFHEQCVERIYCDLLKCCAPEALAVCARYTRRGGIDINPFRSSGEFPPPPDGREVRQ
jgi:7-cyano-7-deazaguanine reductase